MNEPSQSGGQTQPVSLARRVDAACFRFEMAWKGEPPPRIEDYLGATPEPERSPLLRELIALDVDFRRRAGENPDAREYAARFPEYVELIQAIFSEAALSEPEKVFGDLATYPREPAQEIQIHVQLTEPNPVREESDSLPPSVPTGLPAIPGYELREILGRGSMGIVYKAWHIGLSRFVALKMILAGSRAGERERERDRFLGEAKAIARLQHPGIVQIHDIGEVNSNPFFALEFLDGGNLAEKLNGTPQSPREAAALCELLARAVHAAHLQKIIHRDLKPANVLLTPDGTPKIADFGLAKFLEEEAGRTLSVHVMGTPSYMAPEQAAGHSREAGPAADVYALGAILYECLTGRPPFKAATALETMAQVVADDPVALRQLQPKTPRDLETICLKCLEKEPHKRYGSAEALAQDLERWLNGEPVLARPVGNAEQLCRWCRRNPIVAGLSAATAGLLVAVALGATVAAFHIADARDAARQAETEAQSQAEAARQAETETRRQLVRNYVGNGLRSLEDGDLLASLPWLAQALAEEQGNPEREERHRLRLGAVLGRCPRLAHVWNPKGGHPSDFSSDGRQVLSVENVRVAGGFTSVFRVWDALTGRPMSPPLEHDASFKSASFSRDGGRIVTATQNNTVAVWDTATGKRLAGWTAPAGVGDVLCSPSGDLALTIHDIGEVGELRLWNALTGRLVTPVHPEGGYHPKASFSPDGRFFLTWGNTGGLSTFRFAAEVWDAATGKRVFGALKDPGLKDPGLMLWAGFSPDGRRILTFTEDGLGSFWDAGTGKNLSQPLAVGAEVRRAAFSPNGSRVVTVGEVVQVWDSATSRPLGLPIQPGSAVADVAFSADGRRLVTAGEDQTVRVWDAAQGRPVCPPLPAGTKARFSPDGRRVVGLGGGSVRVWELSVGQLVDDPLDSSGRFALAEDRPGQCLLALGPDGRLVLGGEGRLRVYDASASRWKAWSDQYFDWPWKGSSWTERADFSPDGCLLFLVGHRWSVAGGLLELVESHAKGWDLATGQPIFGPVKRSSPGSFLAFSPDGSRAVVSSNEKVGPERVTVVLRVWDLKADRPCTGPVKAQEVSTVAFSPDGRFFLVALRNTARLWDAATGEPAGPPLECPFFPLQTTAFSPDGSRVLTWNGKRMSLSDPRTGKALVQLTEEGTSPAAAAFSPDGRWIVTAGGHMARVWDTRTGAARRTPPLEHRSTVGYVVFSPDSRRLATSSQEGFRVWDAATGELLSLPLGARVDGGEYRPCAFTPDGRRLVALTPSNLGPACSVWELAPDGRPVEELRLLAETLSGHRIDDTGAYVPTGRPPLADWQALHRHHPEARALSPDQAAFWHRAMVRECEEKEDWPAALAHLDRLAELRPGDWPVYVRQGLAHSALKEWALAAEDYSKAIARGAASPSVWRHRGDALAELDQWDRAAADFECAFEMKGEDTFLPYAYTLVLRKETQRYRALCRQVLDFWHQKLPLTGPFDYIANVYAVTWACVLAPDSGADWDDLIELYKDENPFFNREESDYLRTYGAVLYRAGKFREAIDALKKALVLRPEFPSAWLLLAMAHHRLGQANEARLHLDRAVKWLDELPQKVPARADKADTIHAWQDLPWQERLKLRLLRREAEGLVRGRK